jgi:small subunit ribosomal protein S12
MITLNQLVRSSRVSRLNYTRTKFLGKNPQKKGICVRVYTTKPKKPHSAIRKLAKLYLPSMKRHVLAYIPGQGHSLSVHSVVMIRGGRVRDIPGMHCKMIRGKYDFSLIEPFIRTRRRSKYGIKRPKKSKK